jgi:hypothetical protein
MTAGTAVAPDANKLTAVVARAVARVVARVMARAVPVAVMVAVPVVVAVMMAAVATAAVGQLWWVAVALFFQICHYK